MSLLATLIAVAAWCGQPITNSIITSENFYTATQVDQCRKDILQCLDKTPRSKECFTQEKLNK
jgi:hypothetical protein